MSDSWPRATCRPQPPRTTCSTRPSSRPCAPSSSAAACCVDGIVGPQTFRALDGARWLLGDRILLHTPGHLLSGDDIAALQDRLSSLGYPCGRVDGVFGIETDDALRDFQRGVGLRPDGVAGPKTLRALAQLGRAVTGGAPHALREADRVRSAGPDLRGRVVVLDPGHSQEEPGAVVGDLREADVTLDLAATHRGSARGGRACRPC